MGRIKLLHVIGGGEFGGAEQHLLTLVRHLDRARFAIHVACLFPEPFAPLVRAEGLAVHVIPMKSKIDWKPVGDLASLIKSEGFHIVHTHGVRANLIGRLAAQRTGLGRVVTTVHSVLAFDYEKRLDRLVNKICERSTRGLTRRFIVVCKKLAGQLQAEGVPPDKIITIYNGLEIASYDPEIPGLPVRQEFGLAPEAVVAGIIARFHPVKGHAYLLQALARVVRELPRLVLLVVGAGPGRAKLEEMAARLEVDRNVIFTGFRRDIPEIIAALDFLVLPSLSEGLSLTVMEGMAMQRPVLATEVGGTPEIITPGVDGLLVPPADIPALAAGVARLARDRRMAAEIGLAARRTVEQRFTAERMAAETGRLYEAVILE